MASRWDETETRPLPRRQGLTSNPKAVPESLEGIATMVEPTAGIQSGHGDQRLRDGALATSLPEATTQTRAGGETVRTPIGSSVRPLQGLNSHP
jgi:hypothetical protein